MSSRGVILLRTDRLYRMAHQIIGALGDEFFSCLSERCVVAKADGLRVKRSKLIVEQFGKASKVRIAVIDIRRKW